MSAIQPEFNMLSPIDSAKGSQMIGLKSASLCSTLILIHSTWELKIKGA